MADVATVRIMETKGPGIFDALRGDPTFHFDRHALRLLETDQARFSYRFIRPPARLMSQTGGGGDHHRETGAPLPVLQPRLARPARDLVPLPFRLRGGWGATAPSFRHRDQRARLHRRQHRSGPADASPRGPGRPGRQRGDRPRPQPVPGALRSRRSAPTSTGVARLLDAGGGAYRGEPDPTVGSASTWRPGCA